MNRYRIDARGMEYRHLNRKIRELTAETGPGRGKKAEIVLENVLGQRYIGDGLYGNHHITIHGIPGNDLAAFMDGPAVEVFGNGQDGIGNTMNAGRVIIHGDAGDIIGYSMRGGEIYIRGNAGFRCGIHMKSYLEKVPVIVIGGSAGNFLGEYMAGGIIILLGLNDRQPALLPCGQISQYRQIMQAAGSFVGTGMHGGTIYIRGDIEEHKLGKEVKKVKPVREDIDILRKYILNYHSFFKKDLKNIYQEGLARKDLIDMVAGNLDEGRFLDKKSGGIDPEGFVKLIPCSHRPYGKLYTY